MSIKNKVIAITPFICTIAFLLLGFLTDSWHPAWLVFLLIPLMPFLVGKKKIRFSIPLVIVGIYLVLGLVFDLWHPGWVVLILIPVFHILLTPTMRDDSDKND